MDWIAGWHVAYKLCDFIYRPLLVAGGLVLNLNLADLIFHNLHYYCVCDDKMSMSVIFNFRFRCGRI